MYTLGLHTSFPSRVRLVGGGGTGGGILMPSGLLEASIGTPTCSWSGRMAGSTPVSPSVHSVSVEVAGRAFAAFSPGSPPTKFSPSAAIMSPPSPPSPAIASIPNAQQNSPLKSPFITRLSRFMSDTTALARYFDRRRDMGESLCKVRTREGTQQKTVVARIECISSADEGSQCLRAGALVEPGRTKPDEGEDFVQEGRQAVDFVSHARDAGVFCGTNDGDNTTTAKECATETLGSAHTLPLLQETNETMSTVCTTNFQSPLPGAYGVLKSPCCPARPLFYAEISEMAHLIPLPPPDSNERLETARTALSPSPYRDQEQGMASVRFLSTPDQDKILEVACAMPLPSLDQDEILAIAVLTPLPPQTLLELAILSTPMGLQHSEGTNGPLLSNSAIRRLRRREAELRAAAAEGRQPMRSDQTIRRMKKRKRIAAALLAAAEQETTEESSAIVERASTEGSAAAHEKTGGVDGTKWVAQVGPEMHDMLLEQRATVHINNTWAKAGAERECTGVSAGARNAINKDEWMPAEVNREGLQRKDIQKAGSQINGTIEGHTKKPKELVIGHGFLGKPTSEGGKGPIDKDHSPANHRAKSLKQVPSDTCASSSCRLSDLKDTGEYQVLSECVVLYTPDDTSSTLSDWTAIDSLITNRSTDAPPGTEVETKATIPNVDCQKLFDTHAIRLWATSMALGITRNWSEVEAFSMQRYDICSRTLLSLSPELEDEECCPERPTIAGVSRCPMCSPVGDLRNVMVQSQPQPERRVRVLGQQTQQPAQRQRESQLPPRMQPPQPRSRHSLAPRKLNHRPYGRVDPPRLASRSADPMMSYQRDVTVGPELWQQPQPQLQFHLPFPSSTQSTKPQIRTDSFLSHMSTHCAKDMGSVADMLKPHTVLNDITQLQPMARTGMTYESGRVIPEFWKPQRGTNVTVTRDPTSTVAFAAPPLNGMPAACLVAPAGGRQGTY